MAQTVASHGIIEDIRQQAINLLPFYHDAQRLMTRPVCGHCGKPYGKRVTQTEVIKWQGDKDAMPPYRGNQMIVKEHYHGFNDGETGPRIAHGEQVGVNQHVAYRDLWDGATWSGGYNPFCTLRCALDYARKAYARHHEDVVS